jgi:hypothetical protein
MTWLYVNNGFERDQKTRYEKQPAALEARAERRALISCWATLEEC